MKSHIAKGLGFGWMIGAALLLGCSAARLDVLGTVAVTLIGSFGATIWMENL